MGKVNLDFHQQELRLVLNERQTRPKTSNVIYKISDLSQCEDAYVLVNGEAGLQTRRRDLSDSIHGAIVLGGLGLPASASFDDGLLHGILDHPLQHVVRAVGGVVVAAVGLTRFFLFVEQEISFAFRLAELGLVLD